MTLEVLAVGPQALVQDEGRALGGWGVARSGAFDRAAMRLVNRLVGNNAGAAGLEVLLGGLRLLARADATVALTGATCPMRTVNSAGATRALDAGRAHRLAAGTVLEIGTASAGLRAYLGIRGGVAALHVLGSRSRDVLALLGPEPLAAGTVLAVGTQASEPGWFEHVAVPLPADPVDVRVAPGPRLGWLDDPDALAGEFTVLPASDRTGIRLQGAALARRPGDLPSEPTLPGAVQVPPDGQPIILGPDAGVSGGYPVPAVVLDEDLDLLAQVRPGGTVRLRWASLAR